MTIKTNAPATMQSSMQSHPPLPPEVDALLSYVERRRLLLPLLLFVTAHRPLGFVTGQLLLAAQPLTILFPSLRLQAWAETLSDVDGIRRVEERLLMKRK